MNDLKNKFLYKILMIYCDSIDISEGIDKKIKIVQYFSLLIFFK